MALGGLRGQHRQFEFAGRAGQQPAVIDEPVEEGPPGADVAAQGGGGESAGHRGAPAGMIDPAGFLVGQGSIGRLQVAEADRTDVLS